jgi:hypothetical protein
MYGGLTLSARTFQPTSTSTTVSYSAPVRQNQPSGPTTPNAQRLPAITRKRFGLLRFRSPLLSESLLFSLPVGTEMFHFPTFPPTALCVQAEVTGHDSSWVSPFGHPRITARLSTPRGLSQTPTSFIGSWCQGIHHVPLVACLATKMLASTVKFSNNERPPPATRAYPTTTAERFTSTSSPSPRVTTPTTGDSARSLRTQQRAKPTSPRHPTFHSSKTGSTNQTPRTNRPTSRRSTSEQLPAAAHPATKPTELSETPTQGIPSTCSLERR